MVGDDAQAVYGFRGAASGHLLDLASTLPKARTVRLECNFRSRQPLLELANGVRPGEGDERLVLHAARTDVPKGRVAQRPTGKPRLVRCYDAPEEARQVADASRGRRGARRPAARPRRPDARLASQRPARARADGPPDPVREVRRAEVPRGRARQGLPGHPAGPRQPAGRGGLVPAAASAQGRRAGQRRRDAQAAARRPDRHRCRRRRRAEPRPDRPGRHPAEARAMPRRPTRSASRSPPVHRC